MKFKLTFTLNKYQKTRGILSGYRPTWCANNKPEHNSGMIYWSGDEISLGETREVVLIPLVDQFWENIKIGDVLKCMEGSKVVGEGSVIEIIPEANKTA